MATPNYFDPADIETQARYRPGVASNIFNVLTGGLAGQISGSTQRAQEAARARQALLQEEFGKRDEQRMLERQLMINALQTGIEQPTGATLAEKMADFRNKSLRKQIATTEGKLFGYGQQMGPMESQAEPAFQIAAGQSQAELAQRAAELRQRQELEAPELAAQIRGFGETPAPSASAGELRGQLERVRMQSQSRIPVETRASQAEAELTTLQGLGVVPTPMNIKALTPEQKIAQAEIYGRQYQQQSYIGAFDRKAKAERKAIDEFSVEASKDTPDQSKLKTLFYDLPTDAQKDARNRMIAGVTQVATPKERESLVKYREMLGGAQNIATSLSSLAGSENLSKVSQDNFNGFQSWLRGIRNKYGAEDARLKTINDIVQQFEAVVQGKRKDLFGASLTQGEQESAKTGFGDPSKANFLPRMVQFLDGVFSRDVVNEDYKQFGIQVPPELEKTVQGARQNWLKTREQFNFGNISQSKQGLPSDKMSRLEELRRKKNQ